MEPGDPTPELVEAVRPAVKSLARPTPLLPSAWLSELAGRPVLLACESLQVAGCFKPRGAIAALSRWEPARRARGVLDASAGNHGLGLAAAARALAIPCTIVVPATVPRVKAEGMRALGARVVEAPGATRFDQAREWMLAHRDELPGEVPGPADEAAIMAGGGTLALEVLERAPDVSAFLVPAGWGGLAIGVALACRLAGSSAGAWGINSDASPGLHTWWHQGRAPRPDEERETWAEGIQGGTEPRAARLAREHLAGVLLAREVTVRRAARELLLRERLLVEPSGAAGVAAILDGVLPPGVGPLVVVLTGGNLDPERLRALLA